MKERGDPSCTRRVSSDDIEHPSTKLLTGNGLASPLGTAQTRSRSSRCGVEAGPRPPKVKKASSVAAKEHVSSFCLSRPCAPALALEAGWNGLCEVMLVPWPRRRRSGEADKTGEATVRWNSTPIQQGEPGEEGRLRWAAGGATCHQFKGTAVRSGRSGSGRKKRSRIGRGRGACQSKDSSVPVILTSLRLPRTVPYSCPEPARASLPVFRQRVLVAATGRAAVAVSAASIPSQNRRQPPRAF
ncbi:hypothetical protein CDD83_6591 [Cordyceps sp. RAO-2017]|nr:hypothetical protein CDD83_6591 [Cordyceps sp. RAO-2017]